MAGLKEIKIRIKSVKNTKKITYAMKLVAATKMRGAQEAVERSREYSEALQDLIAAVLASDDLSQASHPLLEERNRKKIRLIVIGANRGLCGGFNSNINKAITAFMKEQADKDPNVEIESVLIGQKPLEHYKRMGYTYSEALTDIGEEPANWPLEEICKQAEIDFSRGEIDAAYVIYTKFRSALSMSPKTVQLLPVTMEDLQQEAIEGMKEPGMLTGITTFEPNTAAVFGALLPRLVRITVRQGALDSKAGEHAARMTAMDNATKNAGELIDSLTLTYNKLRQAGITSEILDIVGGANALD